MSENSESLRGGKDGRRGDGYTRAGFSFAMQRKIEDDDDGGWNGSEISSTKKGKGQRRERDGASKVQPLVRLPRFFFFS
jgi:hypothetical protein